MASARVDESESWEDEEDTTPPPRMATSELDEDEDDDDDDYDEEIEDEFSGAESEDPAQEEAGETEGDDAEEQGIRLQGLSIPAQILRLLGPAGTRRLLAQHGIVNQLPFESEEDYQDRTARRSQRTRKRVPPNYPPVPNRHGLELTAAGIFGGGLRPASPTESQRQVARKLMLRELGMVGSANRKPRPVAESLIPATEADQVIHYKSRCYSGQFSDDGNFFYSCAQDFKVRLYDTSNPYKWTYYKTVDYPCGQWTITDATLSPDNGLLAYSSIRSIVCLSPTDPESRAEPWLLDFADHGDRRSNSWRRDFHGYSHFGVWSLRFSGDGREIVAGTSGPSVCVYDIERRQTIISIEDGHTEDVNAVCFGDASSPHILYSGSDDSLIKIWDRRSLGDKRAAGVFMGHTEGLTYVDSKGDGRYVLSNGKDQTMRLWDLRKMMDTATADNIDPSKYTTGFDYRFMNYSRDKYNEHPHDCSVVVYRGHSVLRTLIRCHFSPPGSTNSKYVYTGSEDGGVYIYNIDATLAGRIDVNEAAKRPALHDRDNGGACPGLSRKERHAWKTCVRDVSWHPGIPMIAATSWNGFGMSAGTCTTHSWNDGLEVDEGDPVMGQDVDHRLCPLKPRSQSGPRVPIRRFSAGDPRNAEDPEADDDGVW